MIFTLHPSGMYWGDAHDPSHSITDTRQVPAPTHGPSTTATEERRPGSHLPPQPASHVLATQPNTQSCLAPDTPRVDFQEFSPFAQVFRKSKLMAVGWTPRAGPDRDSHKAASSKPLNLGGIRTAPSSSLSSSSCRARQPRSFKMLQTPVPCGHR